MCLESFSGLKACVEPYPYCHDHHPLPLAIKSPPVCLVKGCTVRQDGDGNYICDRVGHQYQMGTLKVGQKMHRTRQVRLWVEMQTYMDGRVVQCYPLLSTKKRQIKNKKKRKRCQLFFKTEAAIEESITKQSAIWDNSEYCLDTLCKASRMRILVYLLGIHSVFHFQAVICIPGWFDGWTGREELDLDPTDQCIGCHHSGSIKYEFMGNTLWVCPSTDCVHLIEDLSVYMAASVQGGKDHPVYTSTWGKRCLSVSIK
jgi:hypothetical protein